MADAENNLHPSKKRTAGVQLTRDNNGLDDEDEEFSNQETGTFKKASDEVLATRRIVKVRRHQTPSTAPAPAPTSASNPFAGIRLTPLSSTTTLEPDNASKEVKGQETEVVDNNDGKSEEKADGGEAAADEKADTNGKSASCTEKNESNETKTTETEGVVSIEEKSEETVTAEALNGQNSEEGAQKVGEKDLEVEANDKEKNNCEEETTEKGGGETAPVSSFGQLSSTQNAFSGLSGSGFPSAPFSFVSDGLKTDKPTFSFGTSSIFPSNILANGEGDSSSRKNPPMKEVPVETGEEEETTVFTAGSILFEYVEGSWKERGKGELKVNVPSAGKGQSRLVMRTKGNLRLILNANLFPDMKLTAMDKKGVTFACVNSAAEGKQGLSTIALKFRDAYVVEDFRAAVVKHMGKKTDSDVGSKTPESSPKGEEVV